MSVCNCSFLYFCRNFVLTLVLLFFYAGSLTLLVDLTNFSFFFIFICMFVFVHFILSLVFLVGWYHIVIVSCIVITNCSSLVNFLLIYVITPCYVIIFVMLCNLLYSKLT